MNREIIAGTKVVRPHLEIICCQCAHNRRVKSLQQPGFARLPLVG